MSARNKLPLLDWVCDHCGRKTYARREPPKRCHQSPRRPMGRVWLRASDKFYAHANANEGWAAGLPDNYWISPKVIERLQALVDADQTLQWQPSCRRKGQYATYDYATYAEMSAAKPLKVETTLTPDSEVKKPSHLRLVK